MGGLLVEIGRRWERGQLSVIEEHLASSALERALAAASAAIPVPLRAPRCLLAAAEGDEHTLGLSLVELCLREAGWRAEWAGSRTRTSDVLDRLRRGGIRMVSVSASAVMSDASALERVVTEIGAGCRETGSLLALGGDGAWPSEPAYGMRFRAFAPFEEFARTEAAGRR
jgi:methanogenic corrinoid protein MtbC1